MIKGERKHLNVEQIVEGFSQGEGIRRLAKRFGVSHVTIIRRLRASGVIEQAVAQIQKVSPLTRKAAISLFKRCKGDVPRALETLRENKRQSLLKTRKADKGRAARTKA